MIKKSKKFSTAAHSITNLGRPDSLSSGNGRIERDLSWACRSRENPYNTSNLTQTCALKPKTIFAAEIIAKRSHYLSA